MKTVQELRDAVSAALKEWDNALTRLESATDSNRAARSKELADVEQAHRDCADALDRRLALEQARSGLRAAPVSIGGDFARPNGATRAERTYEKFGSNSIFRDMLAAKHGSREAQDRLNRHMDEVGFEERDGVLRDAAREGRAISTTVGAGGEFVPPVCETCALA